MKIEEGWKKGGNLSDALMLFGIEPITDSSPQIPRMFYQVDSTN